MQQCHQGSHRQSAWQVRLKEPSPGSPSPCLSASQEGGRDQPDGRRKRAPVGGHQRLPAESSAATLAWGLLGTPLRPRGVKSISWKAATRLPPKPEGHTCKVPALSLQPLLRNRGICRGASLRPSSPPIDAPPTPQSRTGEMGDHIN